MSTLCPLFLSAPRSRKAGESKRMLFSGCLADHLQQGGAIPDAGRLAALPKSIRPFIARDLALLPLPMRGPLMDALPDLCQVPLAGIGSPCLDDLGQRVAAMCLYPMTGTGDTVALGLVFLLEGEESPHLVGPDAEGRSWTLAAALCRELLLEKDIPWHRIALAKDWILTGEYDGKRVRRVRLGNKGRIEFGSRKWMLPSENYYETILPANTRSVAVWNLPSAMAQVTGQGVRDSDTPVDWPRDVDAFHSLASGAMGPVLMAALFTGKVPVTLWTSGNEKESIIPAKAIDYLLASHLDYSRDTTRIAPDRLESRSIAKTARVLAGELKDTLQSGQRVLFNITQGNLLMRFAVIELAREHPNLWLLYRDVDTSEPEVFEWVSFEGGVPVTRRVIGKENDKRVNWEALRDKRVKPDPYDLDDVVGKFLLFPSEP